ncbi:very short patch repair endonuclease [Gordonia sp. DT30]|uniref:very short patch repair endonuclease n=1 Tax=Gordonia sp. DT30 TaxID=3416546 RepID=UPI003CEADC41
MTTPARSRNMAAIRRTDTKPEVELRSALHRQGLRFRKDYPIRVGGRLIRPDVVFTRREVAVFLDGCFWHSCPVHGRIPRTNASYWTPKLARNVARDAAQTEQLKQAGWTVLRFWAHEDVSRIVTAITQMLTDQATIS